MSEQVIGAAIEVHKHLGCGLLESIYEAALCREFELRGIPHRRQVSVQVTYKGMVIEGQRLDLLVAGELIVEVKAVRRPHESVEAQLLSYLKATGLKRGLIINFGAETLVKGVRRISL